MSDQDAPKTVTLRNGYEHVEALVTVTVMSLRALMESDAVALYEFVCLCRDSAHILFGNTEAVLRDRNLLEGRPDGPPFLAQATVQPALREITLAATEGELLEMRMVDPIQHV